MGRDGEVADSLDGTEVRLGGHRPDGSGGRDVGAGHVAPIVQPQYEVGRCRTGKGAGDAFALDRVVRCA